MTDLAFNGFPGASQPAAEQTPSQPETTEAPATPAETNPAEQSDKPAADPKADEKPAETKEDTVEDKTPAKKAPAKKPTRKSPAKKSTSKSGTTDLEAAVESVVAAGEDALAQVSPTNSPLEVYTALERLGTALGSETMERLSALTDAAAKHKESYNTLIVATSGGEDGSFDGYDIVDGVVELNDK